MPIAPEFIPHKWIRTSTKEAGMGPVGCGDLGTSMPYATGSEMCDHDGQGDMSGSTCEKVECVDEACVNRELAIGSNTGTWSGVNNCWTTVASIIKKCRKTDGECCENEDPFNGP